MKKRTSLGVIVSLIAAVTVVYGGYVDDDFESYTAGDDFTTASNGWHSTNANVVVTTAQHASGAQSLHLPESSSISNSAAISSPTKLWTEFKIMPMLGAKPYNSTASSNSTCSLYFDADGYVAIWTNTDWDVCSNNVWNGSITPINASSWTDIAIYQNFTDQKAVVFVGGVVVLQDIPFSSSINDYNAFVVDNVDSNAYVDDVRVQISYDGTRLSGIDNNGINGDDVDEVDGHGYVGRTLHVGPYTGVEPAYTNIQLAATASRNLDRISVTGTNFSEDVTFADDGDENDTYHIIGDTFTNSGTFTVNSGATLIIDQKAQLGALTVAGTFTSSGILTVGGALTVSGTATLNENTTVASLDVSGSLTVAAGKTLTVTGNASISSSGSITVESGGTLDIQGSLTMASGTSIDVTSGTFTESGSDVDLDGTFTIDGDDWNNSASANASLDFIDKFENYTNNLPIDSKTAQLMGWGAEGAGVKIQNVEFHNGSQAVIIPAGGTLSNRISTTATKVWTEYYIRPALGVAPSVVDTNKSAFFSYVNTNGYMVIPTPTGWVTNDQDLANSAIDQMSSNGWSRVDIFTDWTGGTNKFALFVDGRITCEQQDFPGTPGSFYKSFMVQNEDNPAYLDDVMIMTSIPAGMTNDVNNDGIPDAFSIHNYGTINPPPNGTIFRFK